MGNKEMEKIVIYGAGNNLHCMLDGGISRLGEYVLFVVDADEEKWGKTIAGMSIRKPDALKELVQGTKVAISSNWYYDEIEEKVSELNSGLHCVLLEEFIKDIFDAIGVCNICHHRVYWWAYAGELNRTKYSIIGNGLRNGTCSSCGSIDRNRWVWYVCKKYTNIYKTGGKILHFAPENFGSILSRRENIEYYSADVSEGRADYVVDITNISFSDSFFDYCVANHVLEHIEDEEKAICELRRVTKAGGFLILSFPVCMEIATLEDKRHDTEERKEIYYGQRDHVRLYGNDFKQRLEKYGLEVEVYSPQERISKEDTVYYGFIWEDITIVCKNVK